MAARSFFRGSKPRRRQWVLQIALLSALGLAIIAGIAGVIGLTAGLYIYNDYAAEFVPPDELTVNKPYAGAKIFDRNGEFLYQFVDELNGLRRPVELDEISLNMIAATVATEDASFFENAGVNLRGIARAAWENLSPLASGDGDAFEGSGGSSISQQLAKNLYIPEEERHDRSIDRKIKEAVLAIELNRRYSKEQILTWYLNQINYGGIYYGVEAASQGYFGKPAKELTLAEAALLAGIPQSPEAYDPARSLDAAVARRNQVLEIIRAAGPIELSGGQTLAYTDAQIDAAMADEAVVQPAVFDITAPHFVFSQVRPRLEALFGEDAVLQDGLQVTTTLDMNLQREAERIMEGWIQEFEATSNSHNGAVIVIDPGTGEILTYLGSRDYFREDIEGKNDNLLALNSPGSSFKPFVYLTSFLHLGWSPGTVLVDEPTRFVEDDGTVFQPQNPSKNYFGRITIRNALGNSLNIPPFKTAQAVGVPKVVETARNFGFSTLTGHYGPAIAIGGVDIAAAELTYGYATLANGGLMRGVATNPEAPDALSPEVLLKVTNAAGELIYEAEERRLERRVVEPQQAYMITSILTDPRAQCSTFGCGGIRVPNFNVAVKTGTSEPYDPKGPHAGKIGDTWAFGYTRDFVVGFWAGNANNEPIVNIYSTSISFRSMRDIITAAYQGNPQTPFEQPDGLAMSTRCSTESIAVACRRDLVLAERADPQASRDGQPQDGEDQDEEGDENDDPDEDEPDERNIDAAPGGVTAVISSPGGGAVSGPVSIQGTASSPNMTGYTLDFQSPGGWITIGSWSSPVSGGSLGVWNAGAIPPGTYPLRLTVHDTVRGSTSTVVNVTVQ